MQLNLHTLLDGINKDPSILSKYKGDAGLTILFKHAFEPDQKFLLPEGEPPFRQDAAPDGMNPVQLRQELRRFYVFLRKDLATVRRETLFIQLLENIHPSEAKLLCAIKDQKLPELYPNITHKLVYENGFVKTEPIKKLEVSPTPLPTGEQPVKRGRGRPKKLVGTAG